MSEYAPPGTIPRLSVELHHPSSTREEAPSDEQQALVRELQRRLAPAIRRICPPELAAHADDLVQLAVLRVLRAAPDHREREGAEPVPTSYLWRVAYTTVIDELRRVRGEHAKRDHAAAAGAAAPSPPPSPESIAQGARIGAAIRECLEALEQDRRRAVVLHLQGHSVPETASLLGWVRKRAENLVYRGLGDLRRCLASKGFEP